MRVGVTLGTRVGFSLGVLLDIWNGKKSGIACFMDFPFSPFDLFTPRIYIPGLSAPGQMKYKYNPTIKRFIPRESPQTALTEGF